MWQRRSLAMDVEIGQLERRYESLRTRNAVRERRVLASLAEIGQQVPIVVVRDGAQLVSRTLAQRAAAGARSLDQQAHRRAWRDARGRQAQRSIPRCGRRDRRRPPQRGCSLNSNNDILKLVDTFRNALQRLGHDLDKESIAMSGDTAVVAVLDIHDPPETTAIAIATSDSSGPGRRSQRHSPREKLGLLPNTEVTFDIVDGEARLRKAKRTGKRLSRGDVVIARLRAVRASNKLTTAEIMALMRGKP